MTHFAASFIEHRAKISIAERYLCVPRFFQSGHRPEEPLTTQQSRGERTTHKSKSPINDPAAGSPTATLLRLLPLLDCEYCQILTPTPREECVISKRLYSQPITGNDGRCVQEPGTYSVRSDETRLQEIPRSWRIISSFNPHHDSGSKVPRSLQNRLRKQKLVG